MRLPGSGIVAIKELRVKWNYILHRYKPLLLGMTMGTNPYNSERSEDIPCRYRGEEFAILARETDGAAAMAFAERLLAGIEASTFQPRQNLGFRDMQPGRLRFVRRQYR